MSRAGLVRERFGAEHLAREEHPPWASLRDLQRVRKRGSANRAGRPRHLRQLRTPARSGESERYYDSRAVVIPKTFRDPFLVVSFPILAGKYLFFSILPDLQNR